MRDSRLAWVESELRACRRIALRYFARPGRIELKPDHSPVTMADRTIEERLRRAIQRAFPGEAIIGEEFGASARAPKSYWTIDPIDGTRAFSRGLPTWGMLVSWVQEGRPVLGACDYPALDAFLGVGPGTAAYERSGGRRISLKRAPAPPPLERAVIFHGGSNWWAPTRYRAGFQRVVQRCFLERAYGDCAGYLWLFRGGADAVLDYGVKVWDMAPLAALAHATGRAMTGCDGRPNFTGPGTILAHPAMIRVIVKTLTAGSTQPTAHST
ncbi:MAG: hypothetical protein HYY15_04435 [Candidatus Omnitrophica bacterium]|nr:hypothetical protein [Candidatus Omnitrophota bacterium]